MRVGGGACVLTVLCFGLFFVFGIFSRVVVGRSGGDRCALRCDTSVRESSFGSGFSSVFRRFFLTGALVSFEVIAEFRLRR